MTWLSSAWGRIRRTPYTKRGIARLACVRCLRPAVHQWQICADGNNYRPLCRKCDIELNALVLKWAGHPNADRLIAAYKQRVSV